MLEFTYVRKKGSSYELLQEGEELNEKTDFYLVPIQELDEMDAELDQCLKQNFELSRVARERANAMREIPNKKQHDGYLILSSRQALFFDKAQEEDSDDESESPSPIIRETWKTVLQTPYDCSLAYAYVIDRIEYDLCYDGILSEMGIPRISKQIQESLFAQKSSDKNTLYKWAYHANAKTGLWELDLYTTRPPYISYERRPPLKQKSKKQE